MNDDMDIGEEELPLDDFEKAQLELLGKIVELIGQTHAMLAEIARISAAPKVPVKDQQGRLIGVVPKI